jgi:hypothetical protein
MAMSAMHENVHQGTSEQRQPYQKTKHMRPVLGKEQRAGNDQEADQHPPGTRSYRETFPRVFLMARMILHGHRDTPIRLDGKIRPASQKPFDANQKFAVVPPCLMSASSLLKNPKNLAFVLPRVLLWDDLFKSLKRFGGPDAALATLQPVWGCGSGYRRSD